MEACLRDPLGTLVYWNSRTLLCHKKPDNRNTQRTFVNRRDAGMRGGIPSGLELDLDGTDSSF